MSHQIHTVTGQKEMPGVPEKSIEQEMTVISLVRKERMLQFSIGTEYIHLTKNQVVDLMNVLKQWK